MLRYVFVERGASRPSFAYEIAAAHRRKDYPVVGVLDKAVCRLVLDALGAPLPTPFRILSSIADLTPDMLAEPTALKPTRGSNNRGVFVLFPLSTGTWREAIGGDRLSWEGLLRAISACSGKATIDGPWILEGVQVRPGNPLRPAREVKAYTFRGHIPFYYVREGSNHRLHYFQPQGGEAEVGQPERTIDRSIPAPHDPEPFLALARTISRALPIPFLRVDMYETEGGPVCGELTPFPGGAPHFNEVWDEHLGKLYELSESSLMTAGVRWRDMMPSEEAWSAVEPRARLIATHASAMMQEVISPDWRPERVCVPDAPMRRSAESVTLARAMSFLRRLRFSVRRR